MDIQHEALIIFTLCIICASSSVVPCKYVLEQEWDTGFLAKIEIPILERHNHGWVLYIKYDIAVVELDVFEANLVDGHPNNKEYVFKNKDYNFVVYYYKDKLLNLYLQGSQYPSGDRSVYVAPPSAEVLFIPHLSPNETIHEALKRAGNFQESTRRSDQLKTTTPITTISTTMLIAATTVSTTTTILPWMGWETQPTNILFGASPTTTPVPSTTRSKPPSKKFRHNLREVIKKSLLFFEAQRSGYLPITNRIPWRSHSALRDGTDNGVDLTGGYYTGAGHIKYGFPTAAAISLLSWGAIEFRRGYVAAKELGNLLAAIKWGTDYLLKCHTNTHVLYGQVSNRDIDNVAWGRPEDIQGVRSSYKITKSRPGSDLAAETSAALAAASIALNNTNPEYSSKLRNHSIALFRFADRYRGRYDQSIVGANPEYGSTGYFDELGWAAAWLYGITTETGYLDIAVRRLSQVNKDPPIKYLNWDDKRIAIVALLAQMTNRTEYRLQLLDFCNSMLPGRGANYTNKGLLFLSRRDTTSLACNSAFVCLFAANLGIRTVVYRAFAQQQLNYIAGDAGRSFIVGYGKNSPEKPYHMSSSCPKSPQRCSWLNRDDDDSNPHELTGALVSGPDIWDNFADDRTSPSNTISIYNNAGFQTLAAGILQIQVAMETFSDPEPGELVPAILPKFDKHQDYGQVLRYSNMFYEAQKSGRLPVNSRITWRKSACVDDKSTDGHDLSGGFFNGGDYIKFNFPMAYSTTILAWGILLFPQSYAGAGEEEHLQSTLRWATDYFIKCHTDKYELYGQVGSSALEHGHWLRPEDINYIRPAFKISKKFPGSELAAETAAAMAATASVFQKLNAEYSTLLIQHAKELYDFADKYRGVYHRSIADAGQFYPSYSGYKDELVWAGIWLYLATNDTSYLTEAKAKYRQFRLNQFPPDDFHWDDKTAGINVLLARLTKSKLYLSEAERFCERMIYQGTYTPKGLLYRRQWGPLQYASGAAMICLLTADLGINARENREFAKKQIHYILGDGGMGSYVVGYGPSPPKRPHHRASSCPSPPSPCNFTALYSKENNPNILYGAVVGGPDHKDQYIDDRANARSNKVTVAYNAAFQTTVAGLRYLEMFPPPTPATVTRKARKPARKQVKIKLSTTKSSTTATSPTTRHIDTGENASLPNTKVVTISPSIPTLLTNVTPDIQTNRTTSLSTSNNFTSPTLTLINATGNHGHQDENLSSMAPTTTVVFVNESTALRSNAWLSTYTDTGNGSIGQSETHTPSTRPMKAGNFTATWSQAKIGNSTRPGNGNGTWEETRYCGRRRALEIFDACAIPVKEFHLHPDLKLYRCRHHAFKACVGVQTDNCVDSVWEYWPYWNHNSDDSIFFGTDDLNCKDKITVDIENCELRGLSRAFDDCYKNVSEWNSTHNKDGECRWMIFGTCVTKSLSHCKRTWKIWRLWNMGLPPDQQFSEDEMNCTPSCGFSTSISPLTVVLVISCLTFVRTL